MRLTSELCNPKYICLHNSKTYFKYKGWQKKDKMVFSHLVWGGTRRYGGVGRKSPQQSLLTHGYPTPFTNHPTKLLKPIFLHFHKFYNFKNKKFKCLKVWLWCVFCIFWILKIIWITSFGTN